MTTPETSSQAAPPTALVDHDAADYHSSRLLPGRIHWCPEMPLSLTPASGTSRAWTSSRRLRIRPVRLLLARHSSACHRIRPLARDAHPRRHCVPSPRPTPRRCYRDAPSTSPSPSSALSPSSPTSLVLIDVARVLRPGGRLVFRQPPHAVDLPDDRRPSKHRSHFEREHVEHDEDGTVTYAEFHRTPATGFGPSMPPGSTCTTSSNPSGRSTSPRTGVNGPRSAVASSPAPPSSCAGNGSVAGSTPSIREGECHVQRIRHD